MNGQLRDHPLAELIHEISGARLSGALRVSRERVRGVVYFSGGRLVAALTNLRSSRLSEYLLRRGVLTQTQLDAAHVGDKMSDEQVRAALVEAGVLTSEELGRQQARRTEEVLRMLLQWTDGEWSFDPRVRLDVEWHVQLNISQILIEAARELSSEFVSRATARDAEIISTSAGAQDSGGDLRLLPAEGFMLSRVSAPSSMGELLAVSGLPESEARRAVYVLALGGLLVREGWPRAFSTETLAQAQRASAATGKADKQGEIEESVVPIPPPDAEEQSPPVEEVKPEADMRSEVEELFARTSGSSHYEMLGVTRNAKAGEIKRTYYSLARRFHPDRFRSEADEPLRRRIESAFGKIAQAYEVLKDSATRASYDLKLEKEKARTSPQQESTNQTEAERAGEAGKGASAGGPHSPSSSKPSQAYRAEERFQQGLSAWRKNEIAAAKRFFGEAALLVPKEPRYRAYYGRALARERQTRRQAEAELQAAIALDQRNVSYRVMLAELYRDLGLRRRAEGELERALSIEPHNADARRLLDELRHAG
ncbi:MAG: DnaJ domain-containing protein [Acidobacteria bacterium]|nr:DnaJ domain-containing protein [Acidobacteriota bacterium]